MSPCDSRDFVPALIALCENLRLLLRRPRAPSARSGEDLKPTNRLTLRLVQRLSVRHVSNPLPTQTTSDNRPLANALEGATKGPLTADFRRGADSLAALAKDELQRDPFSGTILVFRSKRADRLKILAWDGSG